MEQTKKNLKITAIVLLILAGLELLQTILVLAFGIANPGDVPENVFLITKVIAAVVAILLLLPQVYVGVRGLQLVKNPNPAAKAHIIWAIILLVVSALGLISSAVSFFQQGNGGGDLSTLLNRLVDVLVYIEFIKYSKDLQKAGN